MTKMSGKIKCSLKPRLRFPEFRDAPAWEETPLGHIAAPVTAKYTGRDVIPALTLSAEYGVVIQDEYFGKEIAGENTERYIKVSLNDFIYNDRTTKIFVYGTIKRLSECQCGLVSPIYKCYRFDKTENPIFWEWYFESGSHESQLRMLVNEGARAGRFNISIGKFLSTSVWRPSIPEQQKIADCFSSLDELITTQNQKVDALIALKKGLMLQLFPAQGKNIPPVRFPQFRGLPKWDIRPLGIIAENLDSRRIPITESNRISGSVPYYGASGVIDYVDDFIFDENLLCISEDGANLVARTTPIAFSISGKSWVNNHAHVLRFSNLSTQAIVEDYLNSIKLDVHLTGMTQPKLNRAKLDNIPIPIPCAEEQKEIAECLSSLNELITAHSKKLNVLRTLKKGLMQQLFPEVKESRE